MSTIVTRLGKGTSLSWQEMDDNLTNLNNDKIEVSAIANMLETSDIGVTVQPYDSTILKDADIGVTVQGYDSTILKDADIGVTVQGYDSTTTKNTSTQTLTNKTLLASGSNILESTSGPDGSQLAGFRNKIINGGFAINQRGYVSGAAVGANLYGHDRWKMAASGDTYTFSTTANKTTVTIPSGKVLRQVIEGLNLQTGTYILSWEGTAQGKIGAGAYGTSGVTGSITGGTNTTIEFGPGTVANIQLEIGSVATPFEHRLLGAELGLCQRYYEKTYNTGDTPGTATMVGAHLCVPAFTTSSTAVFNIPFKVSKAGIPTITMHSTVTGATGVIRQGSSDVAANVSQVGTGSATIVNSGTISAGITCYCQMVASAEL